MKTRIAISVSLIVAALAMANLLPIQAQKPIHQPAQAGLELEMQPPKLDAGAHLNPLKIALLHWYLADTLTVFRVGNQPYGICFDGTPDPKSLSDCGHACHTAVKAKDYIFHPYQKR